jgi:hypothetical protein
MIVTAFLEWKVIILDVYRLTVVGKPVALACGRWVISRSLLAFLRRLPWLKQGEILDNDLSYIHFIALFVVVCACLDMTFDTNERTFMRELSEVLSRLSPDDTIDEVSLPVTVRTAELTVNSDCE